MNFSLNSLFEQTALHTCVKGQQAARRNKRIQLQCRGGETESLSLQGHERDREQLHVNPRESRGQRTPSTPRSGEGAELS